MQEENYWQLFVETGAPEAYLLYQSAKKEALCKTQNK